MTLFGKPFGVVHKNRHESSSSLTTDKRLPLTCPQTEKFTILSGTDKILTKTINKKVRNGNKILSLTGIKFFYEKYKDKQN